MSIALLEFSALQSIILQPLVSMLHDSSEMIHKVNGDQCPPPHSLHASTLMAVMPHMVGDGFKMAPSQNTTLLRFSKTFPPPRENPLRLSHSIPLASFKEIKASMLYMDKKRSAFFQLHAHCVWQNGLQLWKYLRGMFPGPMPLCFVCWSDAFSRMCSNYKDNVSVYRNSWKPLLPQKHIFTFPHI